MARLRPTYGSGEDWNMLLSEEELKDAEELRPTYGSGEDWNSGAVMRWRR